MRSVSMLLIFMTCLVSSKGATATNRASSLLLKSQQPGKVDTQVLVGSLEEVAHGLQVEDEKGIGLASKLKSHCKSADREFATSLEKGKRTFDMATSNYEKADGEVNAMKSSLGELKGQITNSNQELDALQAKLKKARQDSGELKKSASSALRQMDVVIAKTFLRERQKQPLSLERKASNLERLSEALSFVQTHHAQEPADSKPVLVLRADKDDIVRASAATQRYFHEKEKKIIDLIKVEREKLRDLEAILADMQPAFTDKLMQAMEVNRTLTASSRGMRRDTELMNAEKKKCALVHDHLDTHRTQRSHVTNDVLMASKLLGSMDTALFLSRDLVGLKPRTLTSLLQLGGRRWRMAAAEASLAQAGEGNRAGINAEEATESYDSMQGQGPFDKVTQIISGLIASLKAQANGDVSQNQFCQDGLSQNRRDRLVKKNGIDTLTSTIRWSKMAITRLDEDAAYLEKEMHRLDAVSTDELRELDVETQRVDKEFAVHKIADEVLMKGILVLSQLCGTNLLQQGSSAAPTLIQDVGQISEISSRFNQCKEASNLLKSAVAGLKELDNIGYNYIDKYTRLSSSIESDVGSALDARDTALKSTKASRAQRALELATATKDIADAQKELDLIDKTKQELEHKCSHVVTREERIASRAEEVHALKEAVNVLGGESIPV